MRDALSGELLTAKHSNWVNWFQCESKLRGLKGMGECTARIAIELSWTNTRGKPNCAQKPVTSGHQAHRNHRLIGCFHSFATTKTRSEMNTTELDSFTITRIGLLMKRREASAAWCMLHMYGQSWKSVYSHHYSASKRNPRQHTVYSTQNSHCRRDIDRKQGFSKPKATGA